MSDLCIKTTFGGGMVVMVTKINPHHFIIFMYHNSLLSYHLHSVITNGLFASDFLTIILYSLCLGLDSHSVL